MAIQLRCDQVESVMLGSINMEPEASERLTVMKVMMMMIMMMTTMDQLHCCSCVTAAALMDALVNILHLRSHKAHQQHSWRRFVTTRVLGFDTRAHTPAHTLPKVADEASKTTSRSLAASLILSPNYC